MSLNWKIGEIARSPNASELFEITKLAMENKHEVFREMGWDTLNHKINEGDVKCVLEALEQFAKTSGDKFRHPNPNNLTGDHPE